MNATEPEFRILITSAGRRVQLVRLFQQAVRDLGLAAQVIAIDANPAWSAAARVADACHPAPLLNDPDYPVFLIELVRSQKVRLVVPTIDTELALLAGMRAELAAVECQAVVSDVQLVRICRDKRRTYEWFDGLGLETPTILDRASLRFPCFAKPYDGSMSKGAVALLSEDLVSPAIMRDERLMFMEYFSPAEYDEFTVDAYYDGGGALRCFVPRKRVEVRAGEISKGVVCRGSWCDEVRERLRQVDGARGCLTYQFFVAKRGDRCVASELNPRFGGGYPLSDAAGARFAEWLVREYVLGESIPFHDDWRDGTAMTRYDAEVIFRIGGEEAGN